MWKSVFFIYFAAINIAAFAAFFADKVRAAGGRRRIPNRTLLGLAFLGGSLAAYLAMFLFRHKTKQNPYILGVPLMILLHVMISVQVMNL